MDPTAIFTLLEKGLALLPTLIDVGQEVIPLVQRMETVAHGGANGTVSDADLSALEADLDQALADFNKPMAPPTA